MGDRVEERSNSHLVTAKDESFKVLLCGLAEQCFLDY